MLVECDVRGSSFDALRIVHIPCRQPIGQDNIRTTEEELLDPGDLTDSEETEATENVEASQDSQDAFEQEDAEKTKAADVDLTKKKSKPKSAKATPKRKPPPPSPAPLKPVLKAPTPTKIQSSEKKASDVGKVYGKKDVKAAGRDVISVNSDDDSVSIKSPPVGLSSRRTHDRAAKRKAPVTTADLPSFSTPPKKKSVADAKGSVEQVKETTSNRDKKKK